MKTNEEWSLFERLADSSVQGEERRQLETQLALDPELAKRYEVFSLMSEWPSLDVIPDSADARLRLLGRLAEDRERGLPDRELGRMFPIFFGGALAAVLVLAAMNFWQFDELSGGTLEALFGLPSETVESAIVSQL